MPPCDAPLNFSCHARSTQWDAPTSLCGQAARSWVDRLPIDRSINAGGTADPLQRPFVTDVFDGWKTLEQNRLRCVRHDLFDPPPP